MEKGIDFSIIIVSWNCKKYLDECLKSIRKNVGPMNYEIIVVDNASTDGTVEFLKDCFPEVKIIQNKKNWGFGKANNQGILVSQGRCLLLLNPDTEIFPDTLLNFKKFFDRHIYAGILGARLINEDGSLQLSYGKFLFFHTELFYKIISFLSRFKFNWYQKVLQLYHRRNKKVDWISGACMAVRKEALSTAGLMDENIFMYFDEVNWCGQFKKAGWEIWFVKDSKVIHYGGKSTQKIPFRIAKIYRLSQLYFYRKWYGFTGYFLVKIYLLFRSVVNSLLALIKVDFSYIKQQMDVIREVLRYKPPQSLRLNKNILIIKLSAIGDVLMATPSFKAIREKFSRAHITLLIGSWAYPVVQYNPNIDETIVVDENIFWRKRIFSLIKLIIKLRRRRFKQIYVMHWSNWFNLFAYLVGGEERMGFSRDRKALFLTRNIPFTEGIKGRHTVKQYLSLVDENYSLDDFKPEMFLTAAEKEWAEDIFLKLGIDKNMRVIGMAPGGGDNPKTKMELKRWPIEYFIILVRNILEKLKIPVFLFGSRSEVDLGEKIKAEISTSQLFNYIGKLDLRKTAALIRNCSLFISNDSGLLHLAGAVDTPTLSFFGPTTPWDKVPPGEKHFYFYKNLPCSPCYKYGKFPDCETQSCLREISPEVVFRQVQRMLSLGR